MGRLTLSDSNIHPEALKFMTNNHSQTVQEVMEAVKHNKIVVIGMRQNPVVKKARKILTEKNMSYKYMEYGSYFSGWKRRLAIKLWTGWPTYPQIFIEGQFIGGCEDLVKLLEDKRN
jgi:monothiol glutaredoxin